MLPPRFLSDHFLTRSGSGLVLLGVVLVGLVLAACGAEAEDSPVDAEPFASAVVEQEQPPADFAMSEVPNETDAAEPGPAPAETESEPSEPRLSAAERRAIEVAAILDQAGIGVADPGQKTIVLDPGHGGADAGGALNGVAEISSNLDFALRIEEILVANGFHVVLTRRDTGPSILAGGGLDAEGQAATSPDAETPASSWRGTQPDREARVELAEFIEADLFVSIHSNGGPDPSVNGVEVWYHPTLLLDEANQRLGSLILGRVIAELFAYGYEASYLGLRDDTCWRQFGNVCRSLYVLSPPLRLDRAELEARGIDPSEAGFREQQQVLYSRGTEMPAVLVELLFVSNERDAAVLRDFQGRQAIARGVAQGIIEFFREGEAGLNRNHGDAPRRPGRRLRIAEQL